MVAQFLDKGADVQAKDMNGETPLFKVSKYHHIILVSFVSMSLLLLLLVLLFTAKIC